MGTKQHKSLLSLRHRPAVSIDVTHALENYQRAALFGHAPSLLKLGLEYWPTNKGSTLPIIQDAGLSLHYLSLAAFRGNFTADYQIAFSIFWGVDDAARLRYARHALAHARRAAKDEYFEAYALLGMAYEEGLGVEKNDRTALQWYLKGATAGDVYAGKMHEKLRNRGVNAFRGRTHSLASREPHEY
jgi:TPR repeat protein